VCLKDERTGEVHDYTRKQGVEHTDIVFPHGVNMSREELWNAAEGAEKRKDARIAREFELALPAELTKEQRRELATGFARHLVEQYGVAADVALHEPNRKGDQRNHHAHILITTRQISAQGLGNKTDLEQEDKALRALKKDTGRQQIETLRAAWAAQCNLALQRAGSHERVSHKSLKAQGIEREPTSHLGPVATAMERRGERSERGTLNLPQGNQTEREELAALEQQQSGMNAARNRAHQWRQEQVRAAAEAQRRAELERERQQEEQDRERQRQERAQKLEAERKAREEPRERGRGMGMSR
jgi:ATP-dependent exoDNAse (exonuclease V) alpha subunit